MTSARDRLEAEFDAACRAAVEECRGLGYNPTVWSSMLERYGAAAAARELLGKSDVQSGFERLVTEGRIDLTVEFAALNPRWDGLFNRDHREAAWWRLQQASLGR